MWEGVDWQMKVVETKPFEDELTINYQDSDDRPDSNNDPDRKKDVLIFFYANDPDILVTVRTLYSMSTKGSITFFFSPLRCA